MACMAAPSRFFTPFRVLVAWMLVAFLGVIGLIVILGFRYSFVFFREYWVHTLYLAAFAAAVAALVLGAIMVRMRWYDAMIDPDHPSEADFVIPRFRADRLLVTRCFLPYPWPKDWSPPIAPRRGAAWAFDVGDVHVLAWVAAETYGPLLHVSMRHAEGDREVPDARARKILDRFRGTLEFIELAKVPVQRQGDPPMRCWRALPEDLVAILHAMKKLPKPAPPPRNELLDAVRAFLPEKAPDGWSAPIHVPETPDSWQILDDDVVIVTGLVSTKDGVRLSVTIIKCDEQPLDEARAAGVLEHFRNVKEFRQSSIICEPHIRMFLGDFDPRSKPREATLN